jgi:hypothetical protein
MAKHLVSLPNDPAEKAQLDFDQFFSRLGYAITRWAHVDRNLFEFCNFAMGTSKEITAVIFHRSPNIKDHLMLTDALMGYVLNKARLKKWEEIRKMVEDNLQFRNDLAHNPPVQVVHLMAVVGEPKFQVPPPKQWWEISTEPTKLLHKKGKPRKATKEDIVSHIKNVNVLLNAMWDLGKSLPKRRRTRLAISSRPRLPLPSDSKNKIPHGRVRSPRPPRSSPA